MISNLPTPKYFIDHIGKSVDKFAFLMKTQHDITFELKL